MNVLFHCQRDVFVMLRVEVSYDEDGYFFDTAVAGWSRAVSNIENAMVFVLRTVKGPRTPLRRLVPRRTLGEKGKAEFPRRRRCSHSPRRGKARQGVAGVAI